MNSKEALEKLSLMINREKCINSEWNQKIDYLKQIITQDLDQLEGVKEDNTRLWQGLEYANNENARLKQELKRCQGTIKKWMKDNKQLIIDNGKMKKALDILKEFVSLNCNMILETERQLLKLSQEAYELLKEVLEDEQV